MLWGVDGDTFPFDLFGPGVEHLLHAPPPASCLVEVAKHHGWWILSLPWVRVDLACLEEHPACSLLPSRGFSFLSHGGPLLGGPLRPAALWSGRALTCSVVRRCFASSLMCIRYRSTWLRAGPVLPLQRGRGSALPCQTDGRT